MVSSLSNHSKAKQSVQDYSRGLELGPYGVISGTATADVRLKPGKEIARQHSMGFPELTLLLFQFRILLL